MKSKSKKILIILFFMLWIFPIKRVKAFTYWDLVNTSNMFCMERHTALYSHEDGQHSSKGSVPLTPMEAFVASYSNENVGHYYTHVQKAFWMTPLGHSINGVTEGPNELSILAVSYEQWAMDVMGLSAVAPQPISYWQDKMVMHSGKGVYVPDIKINPTLDRSKEAVPLIDDGDDSIYFGPYNLDYVGAEITVGEDYINDYELSEEAIANKEKAESIKREYEQLKIDVQNQRNKNHAVDFMNFVRRFYEIDPEYAPNYLNAEFDSKYIMTEEGNRRRKFTNSQLQDKVNNIKRQYGDKYPLIDEFKVTCDVDYDPIYDSRGNISSYDYTITYYCEYKGVKVPVHNTEVEPETGKYVVTKSGYEREKYVHIEREPNLLKWDSIDAIYVNRSYKNENPESFEYMGAAPISYRMLEETIQHILDYDERFTQHDDNRDPEDILNDANSQLNDSSKTNKFIDIVSANLLSDEKDLGDIGNNWELVDKNGNKLSGNGYPKPYEEFYLKVKKQDNNVENQVYTLKFKFQYLLVGGTGVPYGSVDYQDVATVRATRWYETKEIEYCFYGTSLRVEKKLNNAGVLTPEELEEFRKTVFTFKLTWQYVNADGTVLEEQTEIIKLAGGEKSSLIHFYLKSKEDKIKYKLEEIDIPEGYKSPTVPIENTISAIKEGSI